jgi:hypothetical protein
MQQFDISVVGRFLPTPTSDVLLFNRAWWQSMAHHWHSLERLSRQAQTQQVTQLQ